MADVREDISQTSIRSPSDQSLISNRVFSEMSLLEQEQLGQREVSLLNSAPLNLNKSTPLSLNRSPFPDTELSALKAKTQTREPQSLQSQLKERLYGKPENSGAMQFVRLQTLSRTQISGVKYFFTCGFLVSSVCKFVYFQRVLFSPLLKSRC